MGAFTLYGLTIATVVAAVLIHFEALQGLSALSDRRRFGRPWLVLVILGLLMAHVVECALFAAAYGIGVGPLDLGRFAGSEGPVVGMRLFHFSIETFTTQGVGDVVLHGRLRLLASLEPLVGLMLIGWSTSFTFLLMSRRGGEAGRRRG